MPKVSVIMSIYAEPIEWIRQSIDSVLCQTFTDFEFIIVNDKPGRMENADILEEYVKKDSRVIIIKNGANIGLTKSLNRALDIARGQYVARMDADDISLPYRFEKQVAYLEKHPSIVVVGSWKTIINQNGSRIGKVARYETNPKWVRVMFIQNSQIGHPASMFRRYFNNKPIKYDESFRYAQDYFLWVNMLPFGDINNIPEILLQWRCSDNQISESKFNEQQECAKHAKRKTFDLFGLQTTDSFFDIYHNLTIHRYDMPFGLVIDEFQMFFAQVKYSHTNSLALELIYGTYISFLDSLGGGFVFRHARRIRNSSQFMCYLGVKLYLHLVIHKLQKVITYGWYKFTNKHNYPSL